MLAQTIRFSVVNDSGADVDLAVQITPWKFDSAGALEYGTPETVSIVTVGTGTTGVTSAFDNSTNKHLGAHLEITLTGAGSAGAVVYLRTDAVDQDTMALASVANVATLGAGIIGAEL